MHSCTSYKNILSKSEKNNLFKGNQHVARICYQQITSLHYTLNSNFRFSNIKFNSVNRNVSDSILVKYIL